MRRCGFCGGELRWADGTEDPSAGNTTEKDTFSCAGCPRLYRHVVRERFSGTTEWWGVKSSSAQPDWDGLPPEQWPRWR